MRTGIVGFGLAVAAMVVLTGCSGGTTGGSGTTTGSAGPATTASGGGAPKVTTPLDISRFSQNACGALTATQLTALGVKDKSPVSGTMKGISGALGPNCAWLTSTNGTITIGFSTSTGLSYWYSGGGSPQRLPDIDGQPAILSSPASNGGCDISVGASDTSFYDATVGSAGSDPCSLAQQVATAIAQTIKSGS